jgi:hypothetical protein
MDRETSIDYVHIQRQALKKAKARIEGQQIKVLSAATGRPVSPHGDHLERRRIPQLGSRAHRQFLRRRIRDTRRREPTSWR